jgi:OPA family glycerol-3-phosphate transporter-like MFS transporter
MSAPAQDAPAIVFDAQGRPVHTTAYKLRRLANWFPLGLTYALLYMARYNLTVSKNALGSLMTKEDFGVIFGAGTLVYAFSFLLNGPLTDRMGGKKAILLGAGGALVMNVAMGALVHRILTVPEATDLNLRLWMSVLYACNMYFQSFGAVAIVKVNAPWFHVRERGGFSGIFGTMISSGLFFAFTVNGWLLGFVSRDRPAGAPPAVWWVFLGPALALLVLAVVELFLLRDRPSQAGFPDFDTGDASSGDDEERPPVFQVLKKVVTHPVILVIALVEFCTGVLRNGVMHWGPIYAKEVWALPDNHPIINGDWSALQVGIGMAGVVVGLTMTSKAGPARAAGLALVVVALVPIIPAGWGGLLFAAGVLGGNVAGWVSDLFFQSRRAPAAGGLYAGLGLFTLLMLLALGGTTRTVAWVKDPAGPLQVGDEVVAVAGREDVKDWADVQRSFACVRAACLGGSLWDGKACMCATAPKHPDTTSPLTTGTIAFTVLREGARLEVLVPDPGRAMRAGDRRALRAGPKLTVDPFWLSALIFLISVCVIGTHGLLSGTATMDFGGRKSAATAVAMIDGFVYLGTAVQSFALGFITTKDWFFWPIFLFPFAVAGFVLCLRIWHAKPSPRGAAH